MMHFIYEVGYGTCEESNYMQFLHENKLSEKQLSKYVEECIVAVLPKMIKPRSEFEHIRTPSFQRVIDFQLPIRKKGQLVKLRHLFVEEMRKRDFKVLGFEQKWSIFGWASALDPTDWSAYTDKNHVNFCRRIRRKFLKNNPSYLKDIKIGERRQKIREAAACKRFEKEERKK